MKIIAVNEDLLAEFTCEDLALAMQMGNRRPFPGTFSILMSLTGKKEGS
jgi:hypothetical protein